MVASETRNLSPLPPPAPDSARAATLFVWGIWALMVLANLAFLDRYGTRVLPRSDEVHHVMESLTPGWLWAQYAEHRTPLAKFIWLGVLKLTNYNFLIGTVLIILALSALAFALIRVAKTLRGRTNFTDAFFPLAILSFGQPGLTLLWWQVNHILAPLVASTLLLLIVSGGPRLTFGRAILVGVCLVLLPLCGPGGLPYVPPFALWLGWWGVRSWSSPEPHGKYNGVVVLGLTAVAVLLVGLYFVGYENEDPFQAHSSFSNAGWRASLYTSLQVLSVSLGSGTQPFSLFWGLAVLTLWLTGMAVLGVMWRQHPSERFRVLGLLAFMGATGSLALILGWARSGLGEEYIFAGHYLTKALPASCCVYLIWIMYGPPTIGSLGQMGLFTAACMLILPNVDFGLRWGRDDRKRIAAFERDLHAMTPPLILATRHAKTINYDFDVEMAAEYLRGLHQAGIGTFKLMPPDPPCREIPLPVEPVAMNPRTWEGGSGSAKGNNPGLVFNLKQPERVYAIRLTWSYPNPAGPPPVFQLFWRNSHQNDFPGAGRTFSWQLERWPEEEKTMTIGVDDTIDQFRVVPNNKPCAFQISGITLLVPETAPPDGSAR